MYLRKTGFTLVEVLVASTIGVFIALVAVGTLRAITSSAEIVDNNINVAAEVRFASNLISRDLLNLYRDTNLENTRLIGRVVESDEGATSRLTFYTVGRIKARTDQPEADVYEVEYSLLKSEEKSALYRRLWPNPDPNENQDPGGILTVISESIEVFAVRYFDGEEWHTEWPEDMRSVPELVEISIAAKQPEQTDMTMDSFVVNFPRSGWREAALPGAGAPEGGTPEGDAPGGGAPGGGASGGGASGGGASGGGASGGGSSGGGSSGGGSSGGGSSGGGSPGGGSSGGGSSGGGSSGGRMRR
ncbi:MAG: type II secretion system protein GspJ [Planctomycetota bacterium]|jgi:type II secretion system protein J